MNDSQRKSSPDTNIDCKVFTESPGLVQTYDSSCLKLVQCYTTAPLAKNMFSITFEQEYLSSRGSCFKVSLHGPGNKDQFLESLRMSPFLQTETEPLVQRFFILCWKCWMA